MHTSAGIVDVTSGRGLAAHELAGVPAAGAGKAARTSAAANRAPPNMSDRRRTGEDYNPRMTAVSRRAFGKAILAGVPLAAVLRTSAAQAPVGVSTFSFRDFPRVPGRDNVEEVVRG